MITDEIKFNWGWSKFDPIGYEDKERKRYITPMSIVTIEQMRKFNKEEWEDGWKNRIQMSVSPQRVIKETPYELWNGCIFIDIDYKNWVKGNPDKIIDPKLMLIVLNNHLEKNYWANYYYSELSRSNYGFHFLFYYDCERTEERFKYYTEFTRKIIDETFYSCGYYPILHYEGVFDDCTKSFCQMCYLTNNNAYINYRCNGRLVNYKEIEVVSDISPSIKKKSTPKQKGDWFFEVKKKKVGRVDYIDHYDRWRLFESLSRLFEGEELKKEWEYCARLIPEVNGHNTQYYIDCPYKINDWDFKKNGDEYVDTELLKKFGYEVKMKQKIRINQKELFKIMEKLGIK